MPFSPRILRWRTLRIASLWHGSSPRYIYGLLRLRCHRDSPERSQAIFLLPAPRHLRPPRLSPPPHHFLLHPTPSTHLFALPSLPPPPPPFLSCPERVEGKKTAINP